MHVRLNTPYGCTTPIHWQRYRTSSGYRCPCVVDAGTHHTLENASSKLERTHLHLSAIIGCVDIAWSLMCCKIINRLCVALLRKGGSMTKRVDKSRWQVIADADEFSAHVSQPYIFAYFVAEAESTGLILVANPVMAPALC